ncbi:MAG: hypothetical protein K8R67_17155 [Desulfobacteraceae bacterium]|nr:hypothetical protein [Desulfobacteraceae bacterium]
MSKSVKQFLIVLLVVMFVVAPVSVLTADTYAYEDEATSASIVGDTLVLRPAGMVATAIGAVFFVISFPFAVLGGNVQKSANATILKPVAYTFFRPIGSGLSGEDGP